MGYFPKCVCIALFFLPAAVFSKSSGLTETGSQGVLVSAGWLQDHLQDPDLVLLHVGTAETYDSAHIPGARLIHPSRFIIDTDSVRYEMPQPDSIVALLREAGVNNDSRIVLYYEDPGYLIRTARVYVTLDRVGLGSRTLVLNGGLSAWQEEGKEVIEKAPDFERGNLAPSEVKEIVITAAKLERTRWEPDVVVIDARSREEYYGTPATEEEEARGGHIEGAYSLPYRNFLVPDTSYRFKQDAGLKELLQGAGMGPDTQAVVYCGIGSRASVAYLVVRHLGYPVLLFDGSYVEWRRLELPLSDPVAVPEAMD